jgi:hypothetical protein
VAGLGKKRNGPEKDKKKEKMRKSEKCPSSSFLRVSQTLYKLNIYEKKYQDQAKLDQAAYIYDAIHNPPKYFQIY